MNFKFNALIHICKFNFKVMNGIGHKKITCTGLFYP